MKLKIIVLIILMLAHCNIFAIPRFFEERYRGWLWFDENNQEEIEQETKEEHRQNKFPTKEDMERAKLDNERFAKELDLLKHLAIRYPENLEYTRMYKLKEKEMTDMAMRFSKSWLMANFLNPDIVDELSNPQNIYGRKILKGENKKILEEALQKLPEQVELFVFRKDDCPYCSTLEKHLNIFAKKYGFKIEAISPDDSKSKYFKTHMSPEMIQALQLEVMPTVIAVVSDTRQRFEIARGAVSIVELEEKSFLLSRYLKEQDKRAKYKKLAGMYEE